MISSGSNSLDELVYISNQAVKSLNGSNLNDKTQKSKFAFVKSPFDSPTSVLSYLSSVKNYEGNQDTVDSSSIRSRSSVKSGVSNKSNNNVDSKRDESILNSSKISEKSKSTDNLQDNDTAKLVNASKLQDNFQKNNQDMPHVAMVKSISTCQPGKVDSTGSKLKENGFRVERHDKSDTEENSFDGFRNIADICSQGFKSASFNSQPEIVDIYGCEISQADSLPSPCSEESSSLKKNRPMEPSFKFDETSVVAMVREEYFRNPPNQVDIVNTQSSSLKQGDLSKGPIDPSKSTYHNDVHITKFDLSEKQRDVKQALAQRALHNKPKKKVVHPHIVGNNTEVIGKTKTSSEVNESTIAAAVAASAAVAATQPFMKAQQELENRMQQLLSQLDEMQKNKENREAKENYKTDSDTRLTDLEKQVSELNERRMEHLESLNRQQLQMQAQLLMMSRTKPLSQHNSKHHNRMYQSLPKPLRTAQYGYPLSKSLKHSQPVVNPDTISKHYNYLSEVRELQGSNLDTPTPRNKIPQPTPYSIPHEPETNLGFLQELLSDKDMKDVDKTFSVAGDNRSPDRDANNSARGKKSDKSPVDKAKRLVNSLSSLEKETAQSLHKSRDKLNSRERPSEQDDSEAGPAPLEKYLKYPEVPGSPYPKLGDRKKESKLRNENLESFTEARNVLRQLEVTRATLDSNIEQVMRSTRDTNCFTTITDDQSEELKQQRQIEKLVSRKIAALEGDIQREAQRRIAEDEQKKTEEEELLQKLEVKKTETARPSTTRSRNIQPKQTRTEVAFGRGKDRVTSKVKPPPKTSDIKDEKTRTLTYGKPNYQRGRTTIRDPYLHFKNEKKGVAGKPSLSESMLSVDGRKSRSPTNKRRSLEVQVRGVSDVPRQFYFSPTRGYIPLKANYTGPVSGQMVGMAVPLCKPRLEPGLRRPVSPVRSPSNPVTSTPNPVTAAPNVAMLSIPLQQQVTETPHREAELAKQVLPPIDIDSISPSSSQRSDIQISSPKGDNANLTFLYHQDNTEDDLEKNMSVEESELEDGEGIQVPGYEPKQSETFGPSFPLQTKHHESIPVGNAQHVSDIMAEDLRRTDRLQNDAATWLEQELMARVLSEMMPLGTDKAQDTHHKKPESVCSDQDKDDSLLVSEMIGQGGLQLFIDAGQPVNNQLVSALIREVIQERVNSMLAYKTEANETNEKQESGTRGKEQEPTTHKPVLAGKTEERVMTPELTPVHSPKMTAKTASQIPVTLPRTPPLSPPIDGFRFEARAQPRVTTKDMETSVSEEHLQPVLPQKHPDSAEEISTSIDISEELKRVAAKGKKVATSESMETCHDVPTPPFSPDVEKHEDLAPLTRQETPPASPPPLPAQAPVESSIEQPKVVESRAQAVFETPESADDTEESQDLEEDLPKPIMISVGIGDSLPMSVDGQAQTDQRPNTLMLKTSSVAASSPPPSESSLSDTVNDVVSEGQWLLSCSDGQVAGLPLNQMWKHELLGRGGAKAADLSTASTLRDTEELELDEPLTGLSEGEFRYAGLPPPDQDPMLELLAEMQKHPLALPHKPAVNQNLIQVESGYDNRYGRQGVLNNTGRSLGEISLGQVPPSRLANQERLMKQGRKSPPQKSRGNNEPSFDYQDYVTDNSRRAEIENARNRTPSPSKSRSPSPDQKTQKIHVKSSPNSTGTSRRSQMQYQPVLSDSGPFSSRGKIQSRRGKKSTSGSSRLSYSSDHDVRYSSQQENSDVRELDSYYTGHVTRSADSPSLRRSDNGGLTSSFRSRQSNVKKSVEFDLTGTYQPRDTVSTRSSYEREIESRGSSRGDSSYQSNRSLGLTYSQSADESELKRIMKSSAGPVVIPSTRDDSDISEVDLTES